MPAPGDNIIHYDGRILTVDIHTAIQIEARRGRRWGWFGPRGWWVHLYMFQNWHITRFALTLAEAGVFLKHDPDSLPWLEDEPVCSAQPHLH
ncbi:MAG TPA: hypothetical protein VGD98_14395 [Ktedonobacteraceae bacterium]